MKQIYFIDKVTEEHLNHIIEQFKGYAKEYKIVAEQSYKNETELKAQSDQQLNALIEYAKGKYFDGKYEAFEMCAWTLQNFIMIYRRGE